MYKTGNTTSNNGRGYFRQILDVVNVILILAFLKIATEMKKCGPGPPAQLMQVLDVAASLQTDYPTASPAATATTAALRRSGDDPDTATARADTAFEVSPPAPATVQLQGVEAPAEAHITPAAGPLLFVPMKIDYQAYMKQSNEQTNICVMANSGLGSQLIQVLAQKIIYNDKSFHFVVDDSQYGYKWDDQTGVLKGFFDPRFPVLAPGEYESEIQHVFHTPPMAHIMAMRAFKTARSADSKVLIQWAINEDFRNFVVKNYGIEGLPLYHRFVGEGCSNLQFNDRAKALIADLHATAGIPNLRQTKSVAFHVRRGDKVQLGESRGFSGQEYVEKVKTIPNIGDLSSITDCFVASDSMAAVEELRRALTDANDIQCQFHSLATFTESQQGIHKTAYTDRASTIQFLAELSGLMDATYFIGSFNSNVGAIVAILRKCHYYGAPHYAHSYGVDREGWYYRN